MVALVFRPPAARLFVYTFKEGLLSKIAHDLRIAVGGFEVDWTEDRIEGTFDAASLRVDTPMRDGVEARTLLGRRDFETIEETIRNDILDTRRFPTIHFEGKATKTNERTISVEGSLTLHGTRRPLSIRLDQEGAFWVGGVTLDQRDFGIAPYRAMLGTLRLKPHVRVEWRLPTE